MTSQEWSNIWAHSQILFAALWPYFAAIVVLIVGLIILEKRS